MSTDDQLGSRRSPRQGVGGSPVGSGLTVALAIIAVLAGFFILRELTEDGGSGVAAVESPGSAGGDASGESTPLVSVAVDTPEPTTPIPTTIARVTAGATVMVANANTVGGSAGQMTTALQFEGYTLVDPTNASGPSRDQSVVHYSAEVAGAQAVAESIARDLGGVEVLPMPTPPPAGDGDLGEASVLVLLGDAQAGQTISELRGAAEEAQTATAPDPADGASVAPADSTADTVADTTPG